MADNQEKQQGDTFPTPQEDAEYDFFEEVPYNQRMLIAHEWWMSYQNQPNKLSIKRAAEIYGVKLSTLRDRIHSAILKAKAS